MDQALYGPAGFYRSNPPAAHFRTSSHEPDRFGPALARLATQIGATEVLDVGAGRGELLRALADLLPGAALHGVEVAARPADLPAAIRWSEHIPPDSGRIRLLVANEWLDNVPLDVAEVGADGTVQLVQVDAEGVEQPGETPGADDAAWLEHWWPVAGAEPGTRAEIGRPRDEAWAAAVRSLGRGLAVAIDYAHEAGRRPHAGTLVGYREGRAVRPIPDGSCDLTAHVALDACAAAGLAAGARSGVLVSQRAALGALGLSGAPPPRAHADIDPAGYLRALAEASQEADLRDPGGLGAFRWLVQAVGVELPAPIRHLTCTQIRC